MTQTELDFAAKKKSAPKVRRAPTCHHCGAKTVEYKHTLNIPLVRGLERIYRVSGFKPINLKHLGLTRNQWDNFQKLRYWGLVQKAKKSGEWEITGVGAAFMRGEMKISASVRTYRGEPTELFGERVSVRDVAGLYLTREDFAAEAIPRPGLR